MDSSKRKSFGPILLIIGVLSLSPFIVVEDLFSASQSPIETEQFQSSPEFQRAAASTRTGVLDATEYIQSGINVETTGLISARTDETPNVISELTLDIADGWKSNQLELNVSELRKLFALNGTFTNGFPGVNVEPSGGVSYYPLGWDADSLNDEALKQTLRASYSPKARERRSSWDSR